MQHITTTELRTKSSELVKTLEKGSSVSLVHRSKVIAKIEPTQEELKTFDVEGFKQAVKALNLPKTTYSRREKRYKAHLMKKYGKGLS